MSEVSDVKYIDSYRPGVIEALIDNDTAIFRAFQLDTRSSENRIGDVLTSLAEENVLEEVYVDKSRSKYKLSDRHDSMEEALDTYLDLAVEAWKNTVKSSLEEFDEDKIRDEVSATDLWTTESNSGSEVLADLKGKEYSEETKEYLRDIDVIEDKSMHLEADETDIEIVREILT